MKHTLPLILTLWLLTGLAMAQNVPTRFSLQATITDTLGNKLNGATVMLQTAKDSTLTNYGRTSEAGTFTLKGIRKGAYFLKITYVGMMPLNKAVTFEADAAVDLGNIRLKPIAKELYEVVVKTARAPLTIRGDTVEYDTRAFKVPPGSTVEDLLKKLPGVMVDRQGNIRAQGQEVKRVTVDGKQFFSDDPKTATKNLQAEAISKVQVFSDKTEKAKLTGIDDGTKEKTMNLELKEEFKKGGFGKITGGAGPATNLSARAEVRGSYNKFDKKQQLSLIGLANNTNQTGLSWADYQDFRGSNSFNWNDNADFGFGNGGNFTYFGGGEEEGLAIPITGGDRGNGLSDNLAGGANYNFDTKKTKISSSYYFSQTNLLTDSRGEVTNFIPGGDLNTLTLTKKNNRSSSHRVSFRLERELDSLNKLVFVNNSRYNTSNIFQLSTRDIRRLLTATSTPTTANTTTNGSTGETFGMNNSLIYRHTFKKKGRSFAASAGYELTTAKGSLNLLARNEFFEATNINDQLRNLDQLQTTSSRVAQYKASLLYVEPLAKRWFWESFYNVSLRTDEVDQDVLNRRDALIRNDSLSRYFTNRYVYNRLGTGVRYNNKGLNVGVGGAVQQFQLNGQFAPDQTLPALGGIDRTFTTFVPNVSVNVDLKNNKYLYGGYSLGVQMPTSRQLQPIPDNRNPLFITTGNAALLPALTHRANVGFNYFNPGTFTNFYGGLNYGYNLNQIVYAQTIDPQTLVTSTRPQNISGGYNISSYGHVSFPLKKTKATLDLGGNLNIGYLITPINLVLNQTNTTNYSLEAKLSLTPAEWFTFYGSANVGINNARYSVNSAQNAQTISNSYDVESNVKLPGELYVSTNFTYQLYRNERFGFNRAVPIWNASVYRLLGKAKRMEARLSAFDLLNRNVNISQFAGQNAVSTESTRTLARYFLLSFTYNMRGVKASIKKGGWDE